MLKNKQTITQTVLDLLPDDKPTLKEALSWWWINIRGEGGYRLSKFGYQSFVIAELESWSVGMDDIRSRMDKRLLLDLDHKLKYPYYIDYKNKQIVFYSSKEAMMAQLYGSITDWLNNYESRKSGS